jgi:hypothetical protein
MFPVPAAMAGAADRLSLKVIVKPFVAHPRRRFVNSQLAGWRLDTGRAGPRRAAAVPPPGRDDRPDRELAPNFAGRASLEFNLAGV